MLTTIQQQQAIEATETAEVMESVTLPTWACQQCNARVLIWVIECPFCDAQMPVGARPQYPTPPTLEQLSVLVHGYYRCVRENRARSKTT